MKAIIYNKYGPADVLQIKEIDRPVPEKNEVLIKIHSAEVTKSDCELRSFNFAVKWFWLPLRLAWGVFRPKTKVLGGYFSGEIVGVGINVSKFVVGDEIFGTTQTGGGAYCEYLCLPDSYTFVKKPSNTRYEESAAVPLGGLNALHFMRKANIKIGEKVLINGAGGSIGIFAVQIAKNMGAEVTAVDSYAKSKMLHRIGADHVIDYAQVDVTNQDKKYDVVFNMVVGCRYNKIIKILNANGRYLMANPKLADMLRSAITSKLTDKTVIFAFAEEKKEELIELRGMLEAGTIIPIVDKIYPPDQIAQAHRRVESEQRIGMIVLSFDPQNPKPDFATIKA
jgi:NADPH:quinone reductase-like Zn-dependent oxidoreductase